MEKHLLELKNRPKIEYLKSKSLGKSVTSSVLNGEDMIIPTIVG